MQLQVASSRMSSFTRWLIPLAAILALAGWLYIAPPGTLGKLDAVGYAICHRIDERSFHIGDRQLPLCARCTGEFTAAAVTLFFLAIVSRKRSGMPGWRLGAPLIVFLLAFGIDGSNSYVYLLKQTSHGALNSIPNLYVPNNTLRDLTGSGMGIALASVLFPAFNQTAWKVTDPRPALDWKKLAASIGIILLIDLATLTESPVILYSLAVISTLGVLALLVIVFSMAWALIMKQDNSFDSLGQMWMPFTAGLTLALLMILTIDLLRFRLTGTWGGFPLG